MTKTQKTILVAAIISTVTVVVHFLSMQNIFSILAVPQDKTLLIILPPAAATVFAWLSWAQESSKFALISIILFLTGALFWGTALLLYGVPAILLIVGYRQMRG